jgi:hypothetical protein
MEAGSPTIMCEDDVLPPGKWQGTVLVIVNLEIRICFGFRHSDFEFDDE